MDKDALWSCCEEALDVTERAAGLDRKEAEKVLVSELGTILSRIQATTGIVYLMYNVVAFQSATYYIPQFGCLLFYL